MKKLNSGIMSIQKGLREVKKERKKNLVSNSVPSRAGQENSEKNSKKIKKIKKLKYPFPALFLAKTE